MAVEIPIDGTLDLHTFLPGEIGDLLPDYLAECRARGILHLRIVHGKGTGQLRRSVHALLARSPIVLTYGAAPPERGGYGATLVELLGEGPDLVRARVDPAAAASNARRVSRPDRAGVHPLASVAAATALVGAAMLAVDMPLRTSAAPNGIVSYEMIWSRAGADTVLGSWDARAKAYAAFGLGLDYLFLVLYSTAMFMACRSVAHRVEPVRPALGRAGLRLALAMPVAGACDAVENLGLFFLLLGTASDGWAPVASGFASVKFTILLAGTCYLVVALVIARDRRP
jgi:hypothetical protein